MPDDPLDPDWLRAEVLRSVGFWDHLEVVPETGSTNEDLADQFRRGSSTAGAVLIADFQSAGRGRQGRTWTAPPGTSIAMSVLVAPRRQEAWTWLPLLAGLAVADGLRAVASVDTVLKWPNDVLVGEEKICGILAERVSGPHGPGCVLGMGINVHLDREDLPVPTATSLKLLRPTVGHVRNELIATILALLDVWLGRWEAGADDDSALREAYRRRCATLGRTVEIHAGAGRVVMGVADEIDRDGRLVVHADRGPEVFAAGDVIHVR